MPTDEEHARLIRDSAPPGATVEEVIRQGIVKGKELRSLETIQFLQTSVDTIIAFASSKENAVKLVAYIIEKLKP